MREINFNSLIRCLPGAKLLSLGKDFKVAGISCDSGLTKKGFVFVAQKGLSCDGHSFIAKAVDNGAQAVIVQNAAAKIKSVKGVTFLKVSDTKEALVKLAGAFYRNPEKKLKFIGVTGTNGKTTITYLIEAILKSSGHKTAVIGTINYRFSGRVIPAGNTTPGILTLQSLFSEMLKKDVDSVVMEVSSHALDQQRIKGIDFKAAIFTNLTQDHLDYHKTMNAYFKAKSRLFAGLSSKALAVINNDDDFGTKLKSLTRAKVVTYGIDNTADLTAKQINFNICNTQFLLCWRGKSFKVKSPLIGRHNVYNVLAAAAYCLASGISPRKIIAALEGFGNVPGRLERIKTKSGITVFVDYAHTDDALTNVINTLKGLPANRIIIMFGCGGSRDRSKRQKMGRVASELADYVVITSDNPRSEKPMDIISDIKKGINKNNYVVVTDRKAAIIKALSLASSGDIVLLAGKGHENSQVFKNKKIHFDDREVARECLRSMNL